MGKLEKEVFVCFDLETTGLDPKKDAIIELAVATFTINETLSSYDSLVNPLQPIPEETIKIHHITESMIKDAPTIDAVLPHFFPFLKDDPIIVGHGIEMDISFIVSAAERWGLQTTLGSKPYIDTLRLARLYGESPTNSLEMLRKHFGIPEEGAHRALNDVTVNIAVFKQLAKKFRSSSEIFKRLSRPILLRTMPLGKYKGRAFKEIPYDYLLWASKQKFDDDLIFSLKSEMKKRKTQSGFSQAANPFSSL